MFACCQALVAKRVFAPILQFFTYVLCCYVTRAQLRSFRGKGVPVGRGPVVNELDDLDKPSMF